MLEPYAVGSTHAQTGKSEFDDSAAELFGELQVIGEIVIDNIDKPDVVFTVEGADEPQQIGESVPADLPAVFVRGRTEGAAIGTPATDPDRGVVAHGGVQSVALPDIAIEVDGAVIGEGESIEVLELVRLREDRGAVRPTVAQAGHRGQLLTGRQTVGSMSQQVEEVGQGSLPIAPEDQVDLGPGQGVVGQEGGMDPSSEGETVREE